MDNEGIQFASLVVRVQDYMRKVIINLCLNIKLIEINMLVAIVKYRNSLFFILYYFRKYIKILTNFLHKTLSTLRYKFGYFFKFQTHNHLDWVLYILKYMRYYIFF